jgi:hypothetical protein
MNDEYPTKQRVLYFLSVFGQKVTDGFDSIRKFFVNIRYYRLRKRFIRNVNHVAGTAQSPITIKMDDGQQHSVRTYDATAATTAIGYNQRKQWLDQVSKRDRELSAIREEYNSKNLN